jgi:predicted transposase YbfD/YdcC
MNHWYRWVQLEESDSRVHLERPPQDIAHAAQMPKNRVQLRQQSRGEQRDDSVGEQMNGFS